MIGYTQKIGRIGVVVLIAVALAACGGGRGSAGSANGPAVTVDEAKEAFTVGFISVFMVSIGAAFGQEMEGVTLDMEQEVIRMDGFDITEFADQTEVPYTAVSGTVRNVEDRLTADLQLVGGPVTTIAFSLGQAELESPDGFTTTVTANGAQIEITMSPQDMQ